MKRKIGIVGFGRIGQYLYDEIKNHSTENGLEVAFVWNRNVEKISHLPASVKLETLEDFVDRDVDLIVEVAHPLITLQYGEMFLEKCDFMIGSPTALADLKIENKLCERLKVCQHGLYVPAGAFWGGEDILKMANQCSLKALKVTMKKHPSSLKLLGELAERNATVGDEAVVLYDGPVRGLCPQAPSNVNTMACAAIAAANLGFDKVQGCLVADRSLSCHVVEIDVYGPSNNQGVGFHVRTVRTNPCEQGAVTGSATYASFLQSVQRAHGKGNGIHLC